MIKHIIATALLLTPLTLAAQDDFGYDLSIGGETKIAKGYKLDIEASMRTRNDAKDLDRFIVGTGVSFRLWQSKDKKLSVKRTTGVEFLWIRRPQETEMKYFHDDANLVQDGYFQAGDLRGWNTTEAYWRHRLRLNAALSVNYTPNKRWSFTLKETVLHSHYFTISAPRTKWRIDEYNVTSMVDPSDANYIASDYAFDTDNYWMYSPYVYNEDTYTGNDNLDADGNVVGRTLNQDSDRKYRKDRTILRSKLTITYDIKGFPIDLFASVDYGCGLNFNANKWRFNGGYDYKINKNNKLTVFYRFTTHDGDDEPNGHLVGLGYKFDF